MTIRLYLRKDREDKKGECPIYLVFNDGEGEIMFPTKRKVAPEYWNQASVGNWVNTSYGEGRDAFNRVLKKMISELQEKADKFYLEHHKDPTCEQMRIVEAGEEKRTFYALYNEFMAFQSKGKGVRSITPGTLTNYQKTLNHIKGYEKYTNSPFDFHSLTIGFNDSLINYLTREKAQSINTIGSNIKILKTFLHWAELHHEVKINQVVMKQLRILQERVPMVFLEMHELDKLIAMDLSDRPILDRTRDIFVFQCSVGCRYSDLERIAKECLRIEGGIYLLKMKTVKNKKYVDVPLMPRAIAILEKYKGQSISEWMPSMVECNKHIKTVCKLANIIDSIQIVRGGGVFRTEKTMKKYELITTHSAPRTFVNIMRLQGIDIETICDIVGKSRRTIETYIHTNYTEINQAMVKVWDTPRKQNSPEPGSPREEN